MSDNAPLLARANRGHAGEGVVETWNRPDLNRSGSTSTPQLSPTQPKLVLCTIRSLRGRVHKTQPSAGGEFDIQSTRVYELKYQVNPIWIIPSELSVPCTISLPNLCAISVPANHGPVNGPQCILKKFNFQAVCFYPKS